MKLSVPRDAAHTAVAKALRTMARKTDVPILGTLLLSAHDDHLTLTATDFDRLVTLTVPAVVAEPGEVCVAGKTLGDALKRWPEGEAVSFSHPIGEGDTRCLVTCGRSRIRLSTLPAADFPRIDYGETDVAFEMAGAELAEALSLCLPHVCDDDTRYYLQGVAIGENAKGELAFVATQGHTLVRKTMPMPEDGGGLSLRIVPTSGATEISKIAADRKTEPVEVAFSDRTARIDAGDVVYVARLIEGEYPDYERIIPKDFARSATVSAKDVIHAAQRAAVVLKGEATGVTLTFGEELAIRARLGDAEAESAADVVFDGPEFAVGVNVNYLTDCLSAIGNADAELSFQADAVSPIVITGESAPGVTIVIMPVRI